MSLVAEIIASAKNGIGMQDFDAECEELFSQADHAKEKVCNRLNSQYVLMSSVIEETKVLLDNINTCENKIHTLDDRMQEVIPSLEGSASEVTRLTNRLEEIKLQSVCVRFLLDIHLHLEKSDEALRSSLFYIAVEHLNKAEKFVDEASQREVESQLDILVGLQDQVDLIRSKIIECIEEKWAELLNLSDEGSEESGQVARLVIQDHDAKEQQAGLWPQMLRALEALGELKPRIRTFGRRLLGTFLKPVVLGGFSPEINQKQNSSVLVLHKVDPEEESTSSTVLEVLQYLQAVFEFLKHHFERFSIRGDGDDESSWFMNRLGESIGDDFVKLLMTTCLEESVPSDRKKLEEFNLVQESVDKFHSFLVQIGFYSNADRSLPDFVSNVDAACGRKNQQTILAKARALIMSSLDKTRPVSQSQGLELSTGVKIKSEFKPETSPSKSPSPLKLSPKTFELPPCLVSESVCELLELIYETLDDATQNSPGVAVSLFTTVRSVLSLYCHITPTAHSHTLDNIPEHAALIHTNSMLLAHHVMLLGTKYKGKLLPSSNSLSQQTAVDLALLVRDCGCEVFLKALQKHKKHMLDLLKTGIDSTSLKCDGPSVDPLYRKVRESADHLHRLAKAWRPILPPSVYSKSIGTLCGSVVEELVNCFTTLEEISADDCLGLIKVLKLLEDELPHLFEGGLKEASERVSMWGKMSELIVVFESSLRDLRNRWADGKGPLASHFSASEMKQLVRAIFQNTDRRAQFLAEIR